MRRIAPRNCATPAPQAAWALPFTLDQQITINQSGVVGTIDPVFDVTGGLGLSSGATNFALNDIMVFDVTLECTPLTVSFEVEPGTYWLVAGASGASDLAVCGARYTARVTGSAEECACAEDLDGNGDIGPFDLALLLGAWGPCSGCSADINGDGTVGPFDLALLLGAWGPC